MSETQLLRSKATIAGTLALLIVTFVSAKTYADKRVGVSALVAPETVRVSPSATTAPLAKSEDDKGFWLVLRPTGFEVKEMTLDAGSYFVVIENATGLDRFALKIQRESGETIQEVRLPRFRKYWKHDVVLPSGRYLVSEVDHPEWRCLIIVN